MKEDARGNESDSVYKKLAETFFRMFTSGKSFILMGKLCGLWFQLNFAKY